MPYSTHTLISGSYDELSPPFGGRAWFGGTSPCIMWAGFEEGPARLPYRRPPQALHSMHTPHSQLLTPLLASPEVLVTSQSIAGGCRLPGPCARWEGGVQAGAPSAVSRDPKKGREKSRGLWSLPSPPYRPGCVSKSPHGAPTYGTECWPYCIRITIKMGVFLARHVKL